jgi:hypothetical protein
VPHVSQFAAIVGVLIAAAPVAVHEPQPPSHVAIDGKTITKSDVLAVMRGLYRASGHRSSAQIQWVPKVPAAMPSDAPLVSYQGKVTGPRARRVIWMSEALAVMDNGDGGPTFQAIYARTPRDRASRQALGDSFARAFKAVSEEHAAFAAGEAVWIHEHVVPGTSRSAAYHLLKSRGLTAYNSAFVKGKSIPARGNPPVGPSCVWGDPSSGAWPTMNQPLPKQEGACASRVGSRPMPNPYVELALDGAFNMICAWSTRIVITFNHDDRVAAVKVGKPDAACL